VALRATEAFAAALPDAAAAASSADTLMLPSSSAALVWAMTWHYIKHDDRDYCGKFEGLMGEVG
jgi:hypothetical protein